MPHDCFVQLRGNREDIAISTRSCLLHSRILEIIRFLPRRDIKNRLWTKAALSNVSAITLASVLYSTEILTSRVSRSRFTLSTIRHFAISRRRTVPKTFPRSTFADTFTSPALSRRIALWAAISLKSFTVHSSERRNFTAISRLRSGRDAGSDGRQISSPLDWNLTNNCRGFVAVLSSCSFHSFLSRFTSCVGTLRCNRPAARLLVD